jgi:phosphate transport system substrate-binding protein
MNASARFTTLSGMTNSTSIHTRIAATLALVSIVASTAIGAHAQTNTPTELPPIKPAEVKGDISVGGSGSVLPLSEKITQQFVAAGYTGKIKLDEDGTSAGIERFCKGERDVIGTSRALKTVEIDASKKSKRNALEMKVGIDALVFVVSRNNRFVDKLTTKQLQDIWSGKAATWKQVDARWPDKPIALYAPTQAHSSYDFATEQLFAETEKDAAARKKIIAGVKGVSLKAQYREMVAPINNDAFTMGFVSYSYYGANRSKLRVVSVDGTTPNDKTVGSGGYKLTRNIYIVTAQSIMKERPQVKSFINYYLSNLQANVVETGYFPQPEKVAVEVRKTYLDAIK